jgi:hypothetical protein
MRIGLPPDQLKGSLAAEDVASAPRQLRQIRPDLESACCGGGR